jgi:hypothetical protein
VKSGNEWILSGAVYPLVREGAISCRARIQRKTKCEDSDDFREICGSAIREEWLRSVLAERENGNSYTETLQPPTVDNFEKWAEEPLSALGERSPRKAVKTPAGRRAVMELLKSFELRDARRILKEGGDPVAFGHIWEGLGLQREDA